MGIRHASELDRDGQQKDRRLDCHWQYSLQGNYRYAATLRSRGSVRLQTGGPEPWKQLQSIAGKLSNIVPSAIRFTTNDGKEIDLTRDPLPETSFVLPLRFYVGKMCCFESPLSESVRFLCFCSDVNAAIAAGPPVSSAATASLIRSRRTGTLLSQR